LAQIDYIICPLCCRNYPIKSRRAEFQGKEWNKIIIYVRDCPGGKKMPAFVPKEKQKPGWLPGGGFHIIERLTWEEAVQKDEYKELLNELKERIAKIVKIIFSKQDIQKILNQLD